MAVKSVILRNTQDEGGSRYLSAEIRDNGDLVIQGRDTGPEVERFFGSTEYEWTWTIRANHLSTLIQALGGKPRESEILPLLKAQFSEPHAAELQGFLEQHQIPFEFWSRLD